MRASWALAAVTALIGSVSQDAFAGEAPASAGRAADLVPQPEGAWIVPVRDNVFVIMGAGANITVQLGRNGVLLVDTGDGNASDEALRLIEDLSDRKIRQIINTHYDPEHLGGNAALATAGIAVIGGGGQTVGGEQSAAPVFAHEQVLAMISAADDPPPFEAWPSATYFAESQTMFFNGEGIEILHQPNAHSDGDSIVYFRGSNVVSAGDVYTPDRYPYFDVAKGGSLQGIIDALNRILQITIPENMQEGGTLVIPGHGRVGNESDVVEYRDMLTIIRNYIQEMIREGKSLQAIQKARPTSGFDPLYAAGTSGWTVEQFVEAVYRELAQ